MASNRFQVEVVGESYYQDNLERICGKRSEEGEDRKVMAELVLENDNPHDENAVRVEINGLTVGHLGREMARAYRQQGPPVRASYEANIKGGWKRRGEMGHYGVRLAWPGATTARPKRKSGQWVLYGLAAIGLATCACLGCGLIGSIAGGG